MRNTIIAAVSGYPLQIGTQPISESFDLVIDHWSDRISRVVAGKPDVIVLPELFDRPVVKGGPSQPLSVERAKEFALVKGDRIRDAIAELAIAHRCYMTYPSYRLVDGEIRNSLEIIGRDGATVGTYDKLVPTLGEVDGVGVVPGEGVLAADLDFGRVSAAICFDLNFEAVRAAVAATRPQLILFPSAYHGGMMQNYWALSCRSYFVGAVYPPNSNSMINPLGELIGSASTYDFLLTQKINLDYAVVHLDNHREKLLELKRRHGTLVDIYDPGRLGMVLVTSESHEHTAHEFLNEFEIEQADDYLTRSSGHLK